MLDFKMVEKNFFFFFCHGISRPRSWLLLLAAGDADRGKEGARTGAASQINRGEERLRHLEVPERQRGSAVALLASSLSGGGSECGQSGGISGSR